jgi:acetyl-CoA acyltransferase
MATLKPAFKPDGKITAGTASAMVDGSAAIVLSSRQKAQELGVKPLARIIATATISINPETGFLSGPMPATRKVLAKSGLKLQDIDVFEVNEAFASVPMAWLREFDVDPSKLNPNGGGISLGHPIGCTGARIMTTMLHELMRTGGRYGLQAICIGFGQATATIIELL